MSITKCCALTALSALLLAVGCERLDTSWHTRQGELHQSDAAKGQIKPGEEAWRCLRYAKVGEVLPNGQKAGHHDVLWEWKMELVNGTNKTVGIQTQFFLVTADKLNMSSSNDPPDKDKWAAVPPGERKVFKGRGFIDKRIIPRIARGRGRFRYRPLQGGQTAQGKQKPVPVPPRKEQTR